jgi:hypothetical protein
MMRHPELGSGCDIFWREEEKILLMIFRMGDRAMLTFYLNGMKDAS